MKTHNGMRLVRLPAPRSKHFETFFHTLVSSIHTLSEPYDIVHYHTLGPALFSFIPRLVGKKTAVTVQGLDRQRKKWGTIASSVLRFGEYAAVRFPDETMVVSRTLRSYYREPYGARTRYVANGAILREKQPAARIKEMGLEPGAYVLFLGRFSPEKNCHLLIEAFEQIDTPVKLVLAGGGRSSDPYSQELRRHASDRIVLLDYVAGNTFDELLTNAILFVLPSDLEGLSLALLEAIGRGPMCAGQRHSREPRTHGRRRLHFPTRRCCRLDAHAGAPHPGRFASGRCRTGGTKGHRGAISLAQDHKGD